MIINSTVKIRTINLVLFLSFSTVFAREYEWIAKDRTTWVEAYFASMKNISDLDKHHKWVDEKIRNTIKTKAETTKSAKDFHQLIRLSYAAYNYREFT